MERATKIKVTLDQTALNPIAQVPEMELESRIEIDTQKRILRGKAVILIDPVTGEALGATDFFRFPTSTIEEFTKAGAVQNTWYTMFTLTNASVVLCGLGITVADETVEMRITIDGEVFTTVGGIALTFAGNMCTQASYPRTSTLNKGYFTQTAASNAWNMVGSPYVEHWLKGKSITIEGRKTTAGGASALRGYVQYLQYG